MNSEFPYQLAAFIDNEPEIGELVYDGRNGWFPQIALKRRFKTVGISEDELFVKIEEYCKSHETMTITTGALMKPERMPVRVVEVSPRPELMAFHNDFISFMGSTILSRYPERDGVNYLPHVTAEYNGRMVIDAEKFTDRSFDISKVYLLKDADMTPGSEDAIAYRTFDLS